MNLSIRLILLALAVALFLISVFVTNPTDWWALGLASFAAAFVVSEGGWDRRFGDASPRT